MRCNTLRSKLYSHYDSNRQRVLQRTVQSILVRSGFWEAHGRISALGPRYFFSLVVAERRRPRGERDSMTHLLVLLGAWTFAFRTDGPDGASIAAEPERPTGGYRTPGRFFYGPREPPQGRSKTKIISKDMYLKINQDARARVASAEHRFSAAAQAAEKVLDYVYSNSKLERNFSNF